jgi:hypothetical protein
LSSKWALERRPSPVGWLQHTGPADLPADVDLADPKRRLGLITPEQAEPVLTEFFGRTREFLARHAPPGEVGTQGAETVLARVYWLV